MFHKNIILAAQRPHDLDSNNNNSIGFSSKSEKYSLRQRHKRPIVDDRSGDDSGGGGAGYGGIDGADHHVIPVKRCAPAASKQSSRSAATSVPSHQIQHAAGTLAAKPSAPKKKAKPKAAPLSKYRRKTANARERTRMREINSAFENLRKFVPLSFGGETPASTNEKLTKITTLRLAMKYIQSLNDVLHCGGVVSSDAESSSSSSSSSASSSMSSAACSDAASDSDASSDSSAAGCDRRTAVPAVESADIGYGLTLNEESKDLFKDLLMTAYGTTDTLRLTGKMPRASPTKDRRFGDHPGDATNTIMFNQHQPGLSASAMLHDIGLMFESDGESLHLSEACLSPPSSLQQQQQQQQQNHHHQHQHNQHNQHNQHLHHHPSTLISPLQEDAMTGCVHDLGVLLAESDNDSLELSEPCLSPLAGLDVLGPFGDLLMHSTDFGGEHQHLEMYLT